MADLTDKIAAVRRAKERLVQANHRVDAAQEEKAAATQEQHDAWNALDKAQKALMEAI